MKRAPLLYKEIATVIDSFIAGGDSAWEWDDFMLGTVYEDPFLRQVQNTALALGSTHPPIEKHEYCSPEGLNILRNLAQELRRRAA